MAFHDKMLRRLLGLVSGEGVKGRAVRGSIWTMAELGGENVLRLASNLVLTRLLFPEAFGMMALVHVFIIGLRMFAETGIRASIIHNERGDDPDFLNTAWTIQVGRGFLLWLGACALALPVAALYGEPMLAQLLPVAGLNAVIAGFYSTAQFTANRHLLLGRLTILNLTVQGSVIVATVILAWLMQSVWALVIGGLIGSMLRLVLQRVMLPGIRNRFRWERAAAREMFHFGKFMFASTIAGFMVKHADKLILGGFVTMGMLGVYNIAFFLASVPNQLKQALASKVVFPVYRLKSPTAQASNRGKILRLRRSITGSMLALNIGLAFLSVPLIDLLYDARFMAAGPIMALMCLAFVPRIVLGGYGSILLAHGDSRRHLNLTVTTAVLQTLLLLGGVYFFGIVGAILAPGAAILATMPLRAAYAGLYNTLDSKGDIAFLAIGLALGATACWVYRTEILTLLG